MTTKKILNEDFLIKKLSLKKTSGLVAENLEAFYGLDSVGTKEKPIEKPTLSLKFDSSSDNHIIQIVQGNDSINVANDKFVLTTKNYISLLINETEYLKKQVISLDRAIAKMKSKLDSTENFKNKINNIENKLETLMSRLNIDFKH